MHPDTRMAVVLGALSFLRTAALGGTVVAFLLLAGAVSGRAAVLLAAGVVAVAALTPAGLLVVARRSRDR